VHNLPRAATWLHRRAAEAAGLSADQWLFTLSDLMVLVTVSEMQH